MLNFSHQIHPAKYYSRNIALLTGVYSMIGLKIPIERYYFNYILSLYLPIILSTLLAGTALNSTRDSSSTLVSILLFVAELICSISMKLSLNDKSTGTFTALDLFLLINLLFMFFYQFMQLNSESFRYSKPICSDTKNILDETTYSNKNHFDSFFKFGLTLTYSLFVVSYLFICVTLRYLMSP